MKFTLLDGGEDGEYNTVGFVEIYKIFATHGTVFFGRVLLDKVHV